MKPGSLLLTKRRSLVIAALTAMVIVAVVSNHFRTKTRTHASEVIPTRKDIAIVSALIGATANGPSVRLAVEITSPLGVEPHEIKSMRVYRVKVASVNPMRDHARGIFQEPLGWDVASMEQVANIPGPIEARQEYVDTDVQLEATYAYRVAYVTSVFGGEHFSPIRGVRVHDHRVWWLHQRILDESTTLAQAFPDEVHQQTIGHGGELGLPIISLHVGNKAPNTRTLVILGAVHAGESGPELVVPALRTLLERAKAVNSIAAALTKVGILAIPVVNVDERQRLVSGHPTYLRVNPQGIDINRNFPVRWEEVSLKYGTTNTELGSWTYRGPAPLAAIEARILHDTLSKFQIGALLSYHGLYSLAGAELQGPSTVNGFTDEMKSRQNGLSSAWFRGFTRHPSAEPILPKVHDASPGGSVVTWSALERRAPAFEIEAGGDKRTLELARIPPSTALLQEYQARHALALEEVLVWLASD